MPVFTVSEDNQKIISRADDPTSADREGITRVCIRFPCRIREFRGRHGRGLRQHGWLGCGEIVFWQCSQPSGAPVGPGGGTAKTPGRDGTAKCSPSSSFNSQDGRH